MKRVGLLCVLLLATPSVFSEDPALVFSGAGVSLGRYPRVTARLTYDARKAAQGGLIFVVERAGPAQDDAIRVSEAVITTSVGTLSHAAAVARTHSVPALALPRARFRGGALELDVPLFGPPRPGAGGLRHRLLSGSKARPLAEDEVVTVDASRGLVILYEKEEQEPELDLAVAVRAFEGLRDAQSMIQWFESRSAEGGARLAARLTAELVPRVAAGTVRIDDFDKVVRAVRKHLPAASAAAFDKNARSLTASLAEEEAETISDAAADVKEAGTEDAAQHIRDEAANRHGRLKAAAATLGAGAALTPSSAAFAVFERAARARLAALRGKTGDWREAAAAAGAGVPKSASLRPEMYRLFLDDHGLAPKIEELSGDASTDLRLKSRRIRALLDGAALPNDSELGRRIAAEAPAAEYLNVETAYLSQRFVPRGELLTAVRRAWSSYWTPEPLGRRKRSGETFAPEVLIEESALAEVSGEVFSRDPGTLRRERIIVEAYWGESEGPGGQSSSGDEFILDRRTGREVLPPLIADKRQKFIFDSGAKSVKAEVVPPGLSLRRTLEPDDLAALARIARALEGHFGRPIAARFARTKAKLSVLSAKPLEEPAVIVVPPLDSVASPAANVEGVRPVR